MHPIENMMKTAMEQIKEMVDVNTIVGDPVFSQDGTIILPVSKVCLGFVAGGGEYTSEERRKFIRENESAAGNFPFAGGTSAGISLKPMGFIVVSGGSVRLLPIENICAVDRLLEIVPQAISLIRDLADRWMECDDECLCREEEEPATTDDSASYATADHYIE